MQDIKQSVKELIGEDKFTKLRVLLGLEAAAPMPEEPKKEEKMMGEGKLKDGTMVTYDELEVGYPLMVVTEQGTNPAPDGTHEMQDGTKVSTVNGLITEIIPALPVAPAETEAGMYPKKDEEDMGKKLKELMDAINAKMSAIETEISKQQETNKQMFELIEKIGDLPTSEPKKENQAFTTAKDKKQQKIDSILTTLKTLKTK
ncbi:MAG: hypothetical protein ACK59R_01125 [Pseudomonadota bacterium]